MLGALRKLPVQFQAPLVDLPREPVTLGPDTIFANFFENIDGPAHFRIREYSREYRPPLALLAANMVLDMHLYVRIPCTLYLVGAGLWLWTRPTIVPCTLWVWNVGVDFFSG